MEVNGNIENILKVKKESEVWELKWFVVRFVLLVYIEFLKTWYKFMGILFRKLDIWFF